MKDTQEPSELAAELLAIAVAQPGVARLDTW
jgi:hypothetical protein